jgi:glycosyltransferase involved in cell wall biosynthesis
VIPAYNAASFLPLTIKHALRSTFRDYELVVVNDGSSDDTAAICEGLDPRLRVINQPNMGMSAARNSGIAGSDSEYVALLDSDDIWHPQKLAAQVELLDDSPTVGVCFGEFEAWDGQSPIRFQGEVSAQRLVPELSGWIYHQLVLTSWALPSTLTFRREVVRHLGSFLAENSLNDDWEFMIRASRYYRYAKLRDVVTLYRQHPTRYGMTDVDGTPVDARKLRQRRYRTAMNFALAHLERGELGVGLRTLREAVRIGPWDKELLVAPARALLRRALRT